MNRAFPEMVGALRQMLDAIDGNIRSSGYSAEPICSPICSSKLSRFLEHNQNDILALAAEVLALNVCSLEPTFGKHA